MYNELLCVNGGISLDDKVNAIREKMETEIAELHKKYAFTILEHFKQDIAKHNIKGKQITITAGMGTAFLNLNGEIVDDVHYRNALENRPNVHSIATKLVDFSEWLGSNWDMAYHLDGEIIKDRFE